MSAATLTTAREAASSDTAFMVAAVSGAYGVTERQIASEVTYEIVTGPNPDEVGPDEVADRVVERMNEFELELELEEVPF